MAEFEKIHNQIRSFCQQILDKVKFVTPHIEENQTTRLTYVICNEAQREASQEMYQEYCEWLEAFVAEHTSFLSTLDLNLLYANRDEIAKYVLLQRKGEDVSIDMYRQFHDAELSDLLEQQLSLCRICANREALRNLAALRKHWLKSPLTLGLEEEIQIVSRNTWELASDVDRILDFAQSSQFEKEVYQSQIEIKTEVCDSIPELKLRLNSYRRQLKDSIPDDLAVLAAGTHPFSTWNSQKANDSSRTALFMHDMQDIVRRLVTFGLHVHVGIEDRELALQVVNSARRFLPILLAISASSPFWEGRSTGLASYRSTVFSALPRTGIPPEFRDYYEYERYIKLLAETRSFDSEGNSDPTKIWWDLRIHPNFPTIEFRICDACSDIEQAIGIASLCQAIVAKLSKMHHKGIAIKSFPRHFIEENKWRAIRYGSSARFIDIAGHREITAQYAGMYLIDFVDDVLDDIGGRAFALKAIDYLKRGCSSRHQIEVYRRTKSFEKVIEHLVDIY